jgi:hypothetical protein
MRFGGNFPILFYSNCLSLNLDASMLMVVDLAIETINSIRRFSPRREQIWLATAMTQGLK